jgi:hypothetical protein
MGSRQNAGTDQYCSGRAPYFQLKLARMELLACSRDLVIILIEKEEEKWRYRLEKALELQSLVIWLICERCRNMENEAKGTILKVFCVCRIETLVDSSLLFQAHTSTAALFALRNFIHSVSLLFSMPTLLTNRSRMMNSLEMTKRIHLLLNSPRWDRRGRDRPCPDPEN